MHRQVERNAAMTEDRRARERDKAIEMAVGQIEKQFGKGAIMRLGQGAIAVDGKMVDVPVAVRARALLRRHAAIQKRDKAG